MLDVRLFTDRRFSAASGAVTVTFFALAGFIFLITQYFQVLREFSPLSTGARILPVALSIAVGSVVGGLLATRVGTRTVVVTGLISFGTAMAWIAASVETDAPYWALIVPQMLLMGLGMGLIATPATESIMLVLPPSRAGIGSSVNDATRELGSTMGVAVIGSVFSSIFGAHLVDTAFAATGKAAQAADSVPVAFRIAAGHPDLLAAAQDSFLSGLAVACTVVAGVCYAASAAGMVALPGRRFRPPFSSSAEQLESLGMAKGRSSRVGRSSSKSLLLSAIRSRRRRTSNDGQSEEEKFAPDSMRNRHVEILIQSGAPHVSGFNVPQIQ